MRARIKTVSAPLVGVVLMSVLVAALGPSESQPEPVKAATHRSSYAQVTWVRLGDVVSMDGDGADLYVRLIAVEGDVLLPEDHD